MTEQGGAAFGIGGGGRPDGAGWSRSPVYGANGMACTAHPLASRIAVDTLRAGGSAVDAAIAANAALGLMEPTGCGIGGDLFAILWDPASAKLHGLNGSGRSAAGLDLAELKQRIGGAARIPMLGKYSVTVPGAVDGWFALHERFGRLPMPEILQPAIDYAEQGFPVSPVIAHYFQESIDKFEAALEMVEAFDNARATYFANGAPRTGRIFRNPDLARSYRMIAEGGRAAFYEGEIAETIDRFMRRIDGPFRVADFAAHRSDWVAPSSVDYRGVTLCELPPNGQGFIALQMANILKNVDLAQWPRGSAEVLHYFTEAKRLAYEDAARFYADPDFAEIPIDGLLSEAYGRERFALIDPAKASPGFDHGAPQLEGPGDTTYLAVADSSGMMVSFIQSNFVKMGSGLTPEGLGFMLQNRGSGFALDPAHPNVYAPGKRPFHTIIPGFLMKDGAPLAAFGVMGGGMQPQGHMQVLINMIDYGMNPQEAGDAARVYHIGGRSSSQGLEEDGHDALGVLNVEPGVPVETRERLAEMGHNVKLVEDGTIFGGYQAVLRDPETGVYCGATEMRKDGTAVGY